MFKLSKYLSSLTARLVAGQVGKKNLVEKSSLKFF